MGASALLLARPLILAAALPWIWLAWRRGGRLRRDRRAALAEAGCLLLVECAGLYATWPHFQFGLVGAGDIYHYALQLADAVTQWRRGVFPVLVGQSDYAFNGNVHTLRTAAYYVHLGGLMNVLTGGNLPWAALENLTIMGSSLAGALTAYYAARRLAPGARLAAALVAGSYITGAGLLAPLFHYDLLTTLLTAPWQPLFWLGIGLSLQRLDDREGLAWSVFALGMLWYVHPPIAAWLSPVLLAAQVVRAVLVGRAPGNGWRPFAGAAAGAALTAYAFYSVSSLHTGYAPSAGVPMAGIILDNLKAAWPGALLRPMALATTPYADLQLGYAGWLVLLAGLGRCRRGGLAAVFLAAVAGIFLLLLLPVPGLTLALWRLAPGPLLDVTNAWPMQRFYPMLAALAAALGALAIAGERRAAPGRYRLICALLGVGLAWNLAEAGVIHRRAFAQTMDPATSQKMLLPRNVALTRSSYLLFGAFPPYFSHGHTDPEFELRLIDTDGAIIADNASAVLRLAPPSARPPWVPISPHGELTTDGAHDYLLNFQFPSAAPGTLVVHSNSLDLSYLLPLSGESKAFGSGPEAARTLAVRTGGQPIEAVGFSSTVLGSRVQAIPFSADALPLRLESLIPIAVEIDAPRAGLFESPRVFIPGYRATVNAAAAPVVRSAAGLVAVAVPAGHSRVILDYPGPPGLKPLYFVSLTAWLLAGAVLLFVLLAPPAPSSPIDRAAIRRYGLFWGRRTAQTSLR